MGLSKVGGSGVIGLVKMTVAKNGWRTEVGFAEHIAKVVRAWWRGFGLDKLVMHFFTGYSTETGANFTGQKCVYLACIFPGRYVEDITAL